MNHQETAKSTKTTIIALLFCAVSFGQGKVSFHKDSTTYYSDYTLLHTGEEYSMYINISGLKPSAEYQLTFSQDSLFIKEVEPRENLELLIVEALENLIKANIVIQQQDSIITLNKKNAAIRDETIKLTNISNEILRELIKDCHPELHLKQ